MRVTARVEVSGPLATGEASNILQDAVHDAVHELAQEGAVELKSWVMDKSGRATGFFQNHITTTTFKKYGDAEVIYASYPATLYGPWLEGSSERNRSTRFKGYRLFRFTAQRLNDKAKSVTERHLRDAAARMEE